MMEWISSKERKPEDKKPIRVLIDDEEHIAYWFLGGDCYQVGLGNRCHMCGGFTNIAFIPSKYDTYASHWMPLKDSIDKDWNIFRVIEEAKKSEYGLMWVSERGPLNISKEGIITPIKFMDLPRYLGNEDLIDEMDLS